MPKLDIDPTITNIENILFSKIGSNGKRFEIAFSRRSWETASHTDSGPMWFSRALTKADVKSRLALFKDMYNRHEIVLRRKLDEQSGKRASDHKRWYKSTGAYGGSKQASRPK